MDTLKIELKNARRTFAIFKWMERVVSIVAIFFGLVLATEYLQSEQTGTILALIILLIFYTAAKVTLLYKKAVIKQKLYKLITENYSQLKYLQAEVLKLGQALATNTDLPKDQIAGLFWTCYHLTESWVRLLPEEEVSINALQFVFSQLSAAKKVGLTSVNAAVLSAKLLGLSMIIAVDAAELLLRNDEVSLLT